MSTTPTEQAKLGTTHLIPRGLLNDRYTTVTAVGSSLRRMVEDLERKATETDHLVLWHTARIRGMIRPELGALGFHITVQSILLQGLGDRADVLDLLFAAAMDKYDRELRASVLEDSLA